MLLDEYWSARGNNAPWLVITAGEESVAQLLVAMLREAGQTLAVLDADGETVTPRLLPGTSAAVPAAPDVWVVLADPTALALTHDVQPHASLVLDVASPTAELTRGQTTGPSAYQRVRHACIYPSFDDDVRSLVEEAEVIDGARAIGLTFGAPGPSDVGLVENVVVDRAFHPMRAVEAIELFDLAELQELRAPAQLSTRDVLQAMAAAALARSVGASPEAVRAGLRAP